MDAGGVNGSRFRKLPGVRPAARSHASPAISSRRMVEAVAAPGAVDPESPHAGDVPENPNSQRSGDEAAVVVQAVDSRTGRVLWQLPAESLPALSDEILRAAAEAGPASFAGDPPPAAAQSADYRLGVRAYGADDHPAPAPGRVSRTV